MDLLIGPIKEKFCSKCIFGSAYKILQYESFGNSMDHNFIEN